MNEIHPTRILLDKVIAGLGLEPGHADKAYGDVQGSPTTLTILGGDPVALLLAFKIVPNHPAYISLPEQVEALVSDELAEVSLEDGIAWLTLKNLDGEPSAAIVKLIEGFGAALVAADIVFAPGCVACGCLDDVELVFAEGRCSRLCPACAERLVSDKMQTEQALNKPTALHAFGLPVVFLCVGAGWLVFWFLIDVLLAWWNPDEIALSDLGMGMLIAALGSLGCALGYPLGIFLRRAGLVFRSPAAVALFAVVPACMVGELLFITLGIFVQLGVFDILLAVQMFFPFVASYPVSWIIGKLIVLGGAAFGCYLGAGEVKKVALRL